MAQNGVRLVPNGTNLGILKISFSTFWLAEPKCTETDLQNSQICSIWNQSNLIRSPPDIRDVHKYPAIGLVFTMLMIYLPIRDRAIISSNHANKILKIMNVTWATNG